MEIADGEKIENLRYHQHVDDHRSSGGNVLAASLRPEEDQENDRGEQARHQQDPP